MDLKIFRKGVEFYKGRWSARMVWEGVRISMGRFDTKEEAAATYDKVARRLQGEFARLNIKETA